MNFSSPLKKDPLMLVPSPANSNRNGITRPLTFTVASQRPDRDSEKAMGARARVRATLSLISCFQYINKPQELHILRIVGHGAARCEDESSPGVTLRPLPLVAELILGELAVVDFVEAAHQNPTIILAELRDQ